ncbi:MAG: thiamine pyrophosphate-requiring protein [Rhodospirillales bacterium]|jgi:acetolactate synthase-1/2/3 large subunit|nr:acetolactate synthase [Rhodospirillaceae bacterium]MDP6429137.1 thiamine pyrophosphate-requiring protein [Rhodospirillales bacterium]MDP6645679.1 thiamine pyrophosphate-requiring protein [Rhodospirillales bacterium]MDP6843578.1 thiamine pyrophosphate-requiring protein [Rhodospirillales bacterium]
MPKRPQPTTAAEAFLMALKANGVDYLFANAGTDFAPVIEGLANQGSFSEHLPEPVVIPHETAAAAIPHGYYLMTGKPQALMVHVNVGLANTVMGAINAASENIPLMVLAGRTPITEHERLGARITPIQYGQEMFDQGGMVRESTKWNYELRYPEQAAALVNRAMTIAMNDPKGPVYLCLPREPLAEAWPEGKEFGPPIQALPSAPQPDRAAINEAAQLIADAEYPLMICTRADVGGAGAEMVARIAEDFAVAVAESWPSRNTMPSAHPMHAGFDVGPEVKKADVILVVDCMVPWIDKFHAPGPETTVIHIGPDPLFSGMPVRSFQSDIAIPGDTAAAMSALHEELSERAQKNQDRYDAIKEAGDARRQALAERAASGNGAPMTHAWVAKCLSDAMDDDAVVFNELGAPPQFMDLKGPNRHFNPPQSGGLGWAFPAALGACLADRDRLAIACVGDGSYIFANPVACHMVSQSLDLPILVIVFNNGVWNAVRRAALALYPDGQASKMNTMPITSLRPSPDYTQIAQASGHWAEKVESGSDLPAALERALNVIKSERRLALLELNIAVANTL